MFVSGVIATASLVGILVLGFVAAVLLAVIDKRFEPQREH